MFIGHSRVSLLKRHDHPQILCISESPGEYSWIEGLTRFNKRGNDALPTCEHCNWTLTSCGCETERR
jgi:hypothetical protein